MKNPIKKIKKIYGEGRLFSLLYKIVKQRLIVLKYLVYRPYSEHKILIHCPEYVSPCNDKRESDLVKRLFTFFSKMKAKQSICDPIYLPSSLWSEQLNKSYVYLISSLKNRDINKFHYFLNNFGAWKEYTGIDSNTLIRKCMKSYAQRRYLKYGIFLNQLRIWKWFYNGRKPLSALTYPIYGNQSGVYIDDIFVGVGSFFNEIYGSILSGLISENSRPVIAELGAGYGKLAYFTLRNIEKFTFIDFDLPEVLCLAAYYLMKTFPDKKILLYGEEEYSQRSHEKYEVIFMPSFEISKAGNKSVDLFINKNSLGEMTSKTVHNYIAYISKATRRYFFHMNHENYPNAYNNGERGLLGYEYPLPKEEFRLLFRYPDMGHILSQGFLDFGMDIFVYLYERKMS